LQSSRLLDQVRERIRYAHYSLKTEKAYHYWIRFFILWSATQPGGMRHPREMGVADVETFLSMLANERKVSASTHNQALSALLFLYREVLGIDLPWLNNIGRPQQTKRIPAVLTKDEVAGLLAHMEGVTALLALPRSLAPALRLQMLVARAQWGADRQMQRGGVEVPHALESKYPKVGCTWGWFWLFPSPTLSVDPRSGV
jgi:site-specific recombinase XerD